MMEPHLIIWLSGLVVPVLMVVSAKAEYDPSIIATPIARGNERRHTSIRQTPSPGGSGAFVRRLGGGLITIGLVTWLAVVMIQRFCSCAAIANIDSLVAHLAREHRTSAMSHAMRGVSLLGSPRFTAELVIVTGLAIRIRMKTWRPLVILALVYAGAVILEVGLKTTIVRAPLSYGSGILAARVSSFPSGHCARAAGLYGALAYLFGQLHGKWRAGLCVAAVLLTLILGVSVVYLGWHRATDAIGGWALGAAWLVVVIEIMARRNGRGEKITHCARPARALQT
jgi:membrane-associated phospholipid phosphatase